MVQPTAQRDAPGSTDLPISAAGLIVLVVATFLTVGALAQSGYLMDRTVPLGPRVSVNTGTAAPLVTRRIEGKDGIVEVTEAPPSQYVQTPMGLSHVAQ